MSRLNEQNMSRFRKQLESCFIELDTVPRKVVSRMADVGMAATKLNTPARTEYLRNRWRKTKVHKVGNAFVSGYENNTHYAIYVNNGHRVVTKDKVTVGWVPPVKMLEQGVNAARRQTETIFRQEVAKIKRKSGF